MSQLPDISVALRVEIDPGLSDRLRALADALDAFGGGGRRTTCSSLYSHSPAHQTVRCDREPGHVGVHTGGGTGVGDRMQWQ